MACLCSWSMPVVVNTSTSRLGSGSTSRRARSVHSMVSKALVDVLVNGLSVDAATKQPATSTRHQKYIRQSAPQGRSLLCCQVSLPQERHSRSVQRPGRPLLPHSQCALLDLGHEALAKLAARSVDGSGERCVVVGVHKQAAVGQQVLGGGAASLTH